MKNISETIEEILPQIASQSTEPSSEQDNTEQLRADTYNKTVGNLSGYDCVECLNRGLFALVDDDGNYKVRECKCAEIRRTLRRIEESGLKDLLSDYTFDSFQVETDWQKQAKEKTQDFLDDYQGNWFYAGGQVGAGKTHLCTAIIGELLKQGRSARYMLWRDAIVRIKALVMDQAGYSNELQPLKETQILYIDDFFKTERGKYPTTAEINVAFELLNYRYYKRDLVTLISSELLIDDILKIDEAVGSRICQRSKNYCLIIRYNKTKNYRLR